MNIILDPIFIFVFKWGMMGAAAATVLGQVLTAVLAVWYLCHMKAVKLEKVSFRFHGSLMKKYLPMGICSFLSQFSLVLAMAAINNMIRKYGALDAIFGQTEYAQIPMAVVGIVMKFFQIVISISVGMAAGCIPVVGYNIGAGRKDRAKGLFTYLLTAEAIVGAVALVIVELFPNQLIAIFGAPGSGKSGCSNHDLHGPRGGLWCGLCIAFAIALRTGRCTLFHAGVRYSDICNFRGGNPVYILSIEMKSCH